MADAPRHVEAPGRLLGVVGEAAKRNRDLRDPSIGNDASPRGPNRIPFGKLDGVVLLELVAPRTGRAHLEPIGIAPRESGIDQKDDGIGGAEVAIALQRAGDDPLRLAVVGVDREVEIVLIEQDAQNRPFGRRHARIGPLLDETVDDGRLGPDRI